MGGSQWVEDMWLSESEVLAPDDADVPSHALDTLEQNFESFSSHFLLHSNGHQLPVYP